jgi:hypothetical protein
MSDNATSFDIGGGHYLPNMKLNQFKDFLSAENNKFREIEEDYADKKAGVNRNIGLSMEAIKMLKGGGKTAVDTMIKEGGVIQSGSNAGMSNLVYDPKQFKLPINSAGINQDFKIGDNLRAMKDRLNPKGAVVNRNQAVNQKVAPQQGKAIWNSDVGALSKIGQVAGVGMSGMSAAKGIKNWDKLGTAGKVNTAVNTLSTLSGIGGMLGMATPLAPFLGIAGAVSGLAASAEGGNSYRDSGGLMGTLGSGASWYGGTGRY